MMAAVSSRQIPRMIRGSVVVQRRRCGKTNCRCVDGEQLHESTVLSYSEMGRSRTVMLDPVEVAAVRASVERYRVARQRLEAGGDAGLAAFMSRRSTIRRAR